MLVHPFEGCCTAHIVTDFGESLIADGGNREMDEGEVDTSLAMIESMYPRHAMLVVITNNEQVTANKVLKDRGWLHSEWMSKLQHEQTQVRLWWLPLHVEEVEAV